MGQPECFRRTPSSRRQAVNVMAYCIGGTLLAMTLAWLAARGDERFGAVTFMVSLQDFSKVGDTAVFLGEPTTVDFIEQQMMERGCQPRDVQHVQPVASRRLFDQRKESSLRPDIGHPSPHFVPEQILEPVVIAVQAALGAGGADGRLDNLAQKRP